MTTDKVKAKIQSLCPDAGDFPNCPCETPVCWNYLRGRNEAPITLSTVLRAIQTTTTTTTKGSTLINSYGVFMDTHFNMKFETAWNLEHDNYDWHVINRPETVAFIGGLLGVK